MKNQLLRAKKIARKKAISAKKTIQRNIMNKGTQDDRKLRRLARRGK